ncbi:MAG: PD40 domain-containing protein [Acidobacteriia bacterium]|nr:PD40 domain-containing protein [Terriglobia bacterium]
MPQGFPLFSTVVLIVPACILAGGLQAQSQTAAPPDAACKVTSVQKTSTNYENAGTSSLGDVAVTQLDTNGVYQVYIQKHGTTGFQCITCAAHGGAPGVNLNKPMINWHPSGEWLVVGVEETSHDLSWMPASWQRGFLQSGIWLNIWVTKPDGSQWIQITDFNSAGPANGFVGVSFTPDGKTVVWAEIVNGNIFVNLFGQWKLYMGNFSISSQGVPAFTNIRDITPAGARWIEPGMFAPDGKHILVSSDIGMTNAAGQDQFALDVTTGQVQNLTNSPTVWDEHGLYSPDGNKIVFMSSYPYRSNPYSDSVLFLQTEFMLMNADGSGLEQLTHFNVPGYAESQPGLTVAAVAGFTADGTQLLGAVMGPNFTTTNWIITFAGPCGNRPK